MDTSTFTNFITTHRSEIIAVVLIGLVLKYVWDNRESLGGVET